MPEIEEDKNKIVQSADEMAAAATNFKGHGYDVFIQAREKFKNLVELIINKYNKNT